MSQIPRNYSNHVKSLPLNCLSRQSARFLNPARIFTLWKDRSSFHKERKKERKKGGNASYLQRGHVGHGSMSLNGFQLVQAPVQLLHSLHRQFHVVFLWKEENKGGGWKPVRERKRARVVWNMMRLIAVARKRGEKTNLEELAPFLSSSSEVSEQSSLESVLNRSFNKRKFSLRRDISWNMFFFFDQIDRLIN